MQYQSQVTSLKKSALPVHIFVLITLYITHVPQEESHQFEPAFLDVVWSLCVQVKQGFPATLIRHTSLPHIFTRWSKTIFESFTVGQVFQKYDNLFFLNRMAPCFQRTGTVFHLQKAISSSKHHTVFPIFNYSVMI